MPTATIAGHEVQINDEGFLTEYDEWSEDIAEELAKNIGVEMTPRATGRSSNWLREDYKEKGETATTRRDADRRRLPTKEQFQLFPKKTKKMAYAPVYPHTVACEERPWLTQLFRTSATTGRRIASSSSSARRAPGHGLTLAWSHQRPLGEGIETHLFSRSGASTLITKSRMWDLQFAGGQHRDAPAGPRHEDAAVARRPCRG